MSHLLEFPATSQSRSTHSPPYAVIGINGVIITNLLPKVPFDVIIQCLPKLRQWVLPPPTRPFPRGRMAHLALLQPHVAINIVSDRVEAVGLRCIIVKILQLCGVTFARAVFPAYVGRLTCISIHKTWFALGLPTAGIVNLHRHLHMDLHTGAAVTLVQMTAIWDVFPRTSNITLAMGLNLVQHHIDGDYRLEDFEQIKKWYLSSAARCRFFKDLQGYFPVEKVMEAKETDANEKDVKEKSIKEMAAKAHQKGKQENFETWKRTLTLVDPEQDERTPREQAAEQGLSLREFVLALRKGQLEITPPPRWRSGSTTSLRSVETVIFHPSGGPGKDRKPEKDKDTGRRTMREGFRDRLDKIMAPRAAKDKEKGSASAEGMGQREKYPTMRRSTAREALVAVRRQFEAEEAKEAISQSESSRTATLSGRGHRRSSWTPALDGSPSNSPLSVPPPPGLPPLDNKFRQ